MVTSLFELFENKKREKLIMRIRNLIIAGIAILFAAQANAAVRCNGVSACAGPANELIKNLFPAGNSNSKVVLVSSPVLVDSLPCAGSNGGNNVALLETNSAFKEIYALLLTAIVSNSNVTLRIDTQQANCTLFYASIN